MKVSYSNCDHFTSILTDLAGEAGPGRNPMREILLDACVKMAALRDAQPDEKEEVPKVVNQPRKRDRYAGPKVIANVMHSHWDT
jgi:hypothetical protein